MEPILAPDGMGILMLYEQFGLERYLRLCLPVRFLPKTMFKPAVMQLTATEFSPHGALLVDREVVREACEILLELLPQRGLGLPPLLDLPEQLADSDVSLEIRAAAQRLGLPSLPSRNYERALLEFPESRSSNAGAEFDIIPSLVSKRRRKEFARQQNRLAECGALTFEILTRPKEVRNAFNEFMDLENRGWKGRNQSSPLSKDETALFARDMVTNHRAVKTHDVDFRQSTAREIGHHITSK